MDYNVNNYTINELLTILELDEETTNEDNIISITNNYIERFTNENNPKLVSFFEEIQDNLLKYLDDIDNISDSDTTDNIRSDNISATDNIRSDNISTDIISHNISDSITNNISNTQLLDDKPNLDYQANRVSDRINIVGTISNPNSNKYVHQHQSIISNQINGYGLNSYLVNYVFNTQFRDDYFNSVSSDATFTIPDNIKNVIAISLSACQFPNVIYGFSNINQTNTIFIKEDVTNLEAIVEIPEGNYQIEALCQVLEDNINLQVCNIPISPTKLNYRFFVTANLNNFKVTISNLFYSFSINLSKKNGVLLDPNTFIYRNRAKLDSQVENENVTPSDLFKTMGYIIGFRNFEYFGSTSYTTESTFNNRYTTYVYFVLDEFVSGYQQHTTYGVFPESLSDGKILALIPLSGQNFQTTFDNNSNFIYKTRFYSGPIDLRKINIKILNQEGNLVDLNYRDFAFSLQLTVIYDPTVEFMPAASGGVQ
jgi:hypothetical protein